MADLLETYSLSCKKNGNAKNYKLKFKVAKDVAVTFKTVGDVSEIHLNIDNTVSDNEHQKNYNVTGSLKVQFFQHPAVGSGKDGGGTPLTPDPDLRIKP